MAYIGTYQEYRANGGQASEDEYLRYNKLGKYASGGGGSKPAAPKASGNMVRVGGKLYDANTMFDYSSGYGSYNQINAAQAANIIQQGGLRGSNGQWQDTGDQAGVYVGLAKNQPAPKKAAPVREVPKPKPQPSGGGGGSRRKAAPTTSYTANETVNRLLEKMDEVVAKKASPALEKDPYGIKETKLNQLSEETVRRSFLRSPRGRNKEEQASYSSNMVVDPATGEVFDSAKDAKDAGITNWVYKYQYDSKLLEEEENPLVAAIEGAAATTPAYQTNTPAAQSIAETGYKWRNRNTTNKWYNYT